MIGLFPRITLAVVLILVVVGSGAAYYAWNWYEEALEAPSPGRGQEVEFRVSQGQGTAEIAQALEEAGLIRSAFAFRIYSRLEGKDGQLKTGRYRLLDSWGAPEILEALIRGQVISFTFTVPEGLKVEEITQRVVSQGFFSLEEWEEALQWARGPESPLADIIPEDDSILQPLEGYLFPETYSLTEETSARDLVNMMIGQLLKVIGPEEEERAAQLGLDFHQLLTLASIIEKEAVRDEERDIISGVFHNRLKLGMHLGACPTVVYLVGRSALTQEDLKTDSPYNTYENPGLPPGPIASPGRASIRAALYPTEVDYLYFVAKGDGSHAFSRTYAEHLRNQRIYQGQ